MKEAVKIPRRAEKKEGCFLRREKSEHDEQNGPNSFLAQFPNVIRREFRLTRCKHAFKSHAHVLDRAEANVPWQICTNRGLEVMLCV